MRLGDFQPAPPQSPVIVKIIEPPPETLPNSMPPGEGVASRREGCRCVVSFLFPDGSFPFGVPADVAIISRRQGPYPRCREGGGADEGLRTGVVLTARRP